VVAFESPMLTGTDPAPFASIELLAARYVREVRSAQPDGPYRLAGWGFGGSAAFEIGRRLAEEGADVDLIAVGAAGPLAANRPMPDPGGRRGRGVARPASGHPLPVDERLRGVEREHDRIAARWSPEPAPLSVQVAWPDDLGSGDATLGWGAVATAGVGVDRVPAAPDHLGPDVVAAWAPLLADRLG
jgi:hypothetical protein